MAIQRTQIQDDATHRHGERLRQQSNDLASVDIVQGNAQTISLPDGETVVVNHGLGRPATGFLLAGLTGATSAGYITTVTKDSQSIKVQANGYGAAVQATLWVF